MGLPTSSLATTQPPSPILVARGGAKQSQGSPKAWNPTFPAAGVHGGRTGNILHSLPTVPSHLHHCAASTAGWMGHGHCSPTNFLGHNQARQSSDGPGAATAVQAQPRSLYSHSSVHASLAVPCCSHAPCRTQQCGAKPGLFLHPLNRAPALL